MSTPKIKDMEPNITPEEERAILDIGGDPGDYEAARALYAYADSVRKERDAEWSIVAEYFINKADALKDVRRNVDAELIAALDNYYAAREGLKAFIEEVK